MRGRAVPTATPLAYRPLAEVNPSEFLADLAGCLLTWGNQLADLGQHHESEQQQDG